MKKYNYLKKQYPEYVTKEQLRLIAHISKSHAKWFLDSGIIPCENSGKKTRNYKIALADIIRFLKKRDKGEIPRPNKTEPQIIMAKFPYEYSEYLLHPLPDLFTLKTFCQYANISYEAALGRISKGVLECIFINAKHYILKSTAIKFLSSENYMRYLRYTNRYIGAYDLYEKWTK